MPFPYKLEKPDVVYELDSQLNEISGITYVDGRLICVQDELQDIYELENGAITRHYQSGQRGDSEDVVVIGESAYILNAQQCVIYQYPDFRTSMKGAIKHNLRLKKSFDPEGMCFEQETQSLLIACKGNPDKRSPERMVFRYDIAQGTLTEYLAIDSAILFKSRKKLFNPSGIAIHPRTREIYLIGSKGLSLLIRFDRAGKKLIDSHKLDTGLLRQPEGITFSERGDLFLSSEAKGKTACICMYKDIS